MVAFPVRGVMRAFRGMRTIDADLLTRGHWPVKVLAAWREDSAAVDREAERVADPGVAGGPAQDRGRPDVGVERLVVSTWKSGPRRPMPGRPPGAICGVDVEQVVSDAGSAWLGLVYQLTTTSPCGSIAAVGKSWR